MSRGSQTSVEVREAVQELVSLGYGNAPIYRELDRRGLIEGGVSPSKSTIDRIIKKMRLRDLSGPWSLAEEELGIAHLVIDVVAEAFSVTEGRVWPTRGLVSHVARIRAAVPDVPPYWAYRLAQAYQLCAARERDDRHLDFALGAKPWETAERAEWFALILGKPLPKESYGVHADSILALNALATYEGTLEDMRERLSSPELRDRIPTPRLSRNPLDYPSAPTRLGASVPPLDFSDPNTILASLIGGAAAK